MRIALIVSVCALSLVQPANAASQYTIVDLGPCSSFSFELGPSISSNGMVTFGTGGAVVRWNQGVLTSMPQSNGGIGRGVNSAGTVAGWTPDNVPVAWVNDTFNNLLSVLPNGPANGQANGQHRAFLLNPIPAPPVFSLLAVATFLRRRRRS